jgi:hypothetical protein
MTIIRRNDGRRKFTMPRALAHSLASGPLIAIAALALLAPASLAQTPVSETGEMHPAHVHTGTCAELGDVVAPLLDVQIPADAVREGSEAAHPVKVSQTLVDVPLQELIDGGYAINIHQSAEEIDVYIACGDIGGFVVDDPAGRTELFVGLRELNDSGHTGVARLGIGDDVNQTEISVLLVEPDDMQ